MKKIWRPFLFALLLFLFPIHSFAQPPKLWMEGNYVEAEPIIEKGRTLVPLRFISEKLGIPVEWNEDTKQVRLQKGEQAYTFEIGKKEYVASDQLLALEVAPQILQDRTYVPLRVIAEIFEKHVNWDASNHTVVIGEGYSSPTHTTILKQSQPKTPAVYDTTQGKIKGNRNSMIYHCPGQRDYNRISITNVVHFDTEAEAQAAGYRKAKR